MLNPAAQHVFNTLI